MNIRGINKFTLVDYPGKIACIIFVGNCNFICPYCHNACLVVDPESQPLISEKDFLKFLESRRGKLDAVVISGGEPTLRKSLISFIHSIKLMGFLVKLDTNGSNPEMIIKLHSQKNVDYLGIDYKCPLNGYSELVRIDSLKNVGVNVSRTLSYAVKSKIKCDIRTTVHRALLSVDDLRVMREELTELGIKEWTLQQFNPTDTLDSRLQEIPTYSDSELDNIARKMASTKARGIKV